MFLFAYVVDVFFTHASYSLWFGHVHLHDAYFCKYMIHLYDIVSI